MSVRIGVQATRAALGTHTYKMHDPDTFLQKETEVSNSKKIKYKLQ
jgi:hypothetical protein